VALTVMGHDAPRDPDRVLSESGRAYVAGRVLVSVGCGYKVRQGPPCRQPIVLLLSGDTVVYAFPPSWEDVAGLTAREIVERYGRAQL
jgi:hypothetical protein